MASTFFTDLDDAATEDALDVFGESLVFNTRGDTQTLTGVVGLPTAEQLDEEGFQIESHMATIRVRTQDLSLTVEPGTRITQTTAGKDVSYEVLGERDDAAVEFADSARVWTLIRCKRVGEVEQLSS